MMSSANLMWRTQEILHRKNNPIVPGALMLVASSLVVYRHMFEETNGQRDGLKTFLAMIVVQMLPLVALEMKIMSCADPVGLFCKFAVPVTLMHGSFLLMRVFHTYIVTQSLDSFATLDGFRLLCGLIGAAYTMHRGFCQRWYSIFQHQTVCNLLLLGFVAAGSTVSLEAYVDKVGIDYTDVLSTAIDYVELLAFVPAVWVVYRQSDSRGSDLDSVATKRTSTAFFLFLVIFYLTEDIFQAYEALSTAPVASIAHLAHFCLLLDFAFYVLAHVYNPEKLMGELRRWLPVDLSYEV